MIEPLDGEDHYTEKLFKFSTLPTYYGRPIIPDRIKSRVEFGLNENQRYYLCPQSTNKFHPDIDRIFADILIADTNLINDPSFANMSNIEHSYQQLNIEARASKDSIKDVISRFDGPTKAKARIESQKGK